MLNPAPQKVQHPIFLLDASEHRNESVRSGTVHHRIIVFWVQEWDPTPPSTRVGSYPPLYESEILPPFPILPPPCKDEDHPDPRVAGTPNR